METISGYANAHDSDNSYSCLSNLLENFMEIRSALQVLLAGPCLVFSKATLRHYSRFRTHTIVAVPSRTTHG